MGECTSIWAPQATKPHAKLEKNNHLWSISLKNRLHPNYQAVSKDALG